MKVSGKMIFKTYNCKQNALVTTYIPLCDLINLYYDLRKLSCYRNMNKYKFFNEFKKLIEINLMNV